MQEINTEMYLKKKKIKSEYGRNRYHNMSEEKKQKLKEYQKKYCEANKSRKSQRNKKMHDYIHNNNF